MVRKSAVLALLYVTVGSLLLLGRSEAQAQGTSIDSYIEIIRADVRAKETAIITEAMKSARRR